MVNLVEEILKRLSGPKSCNTCGRVVMVAEQRSERCDLKGRGGSSPLARTDFMFQEQSLKVQPLADFVLVAPKSAATETPSGLILPEGAADKPQEGKVLAVGRGRSTERGIVPLETKVGDMVYFQKYAGTEIKVESQSCILIKEENILAIIS